MLWTVSTPNLEHQVLLQLVKLSDHRLVLFNRRLVDLAVAYLAIAIPQPRSTAVLNVWQNDCCQIIGVAAEAASLGRSHPYVS
jgi:hypothetical protein